MSDPSFFTIPCPSCQGGIEFPAHGIGEQIPCPHCQRELILVFPVAREADPAEQLRTYLQNSVPPTDQSVIAALALFLSPTEPSVLARLGVRYASDDAEAGQMVGRFVAEGFLQEASPDVEALLQGESSAALKALAKQRRLPASGTKAVLAKRLADVDPEAMRARFQGKRFYRCSVKGTILAEKWREAREYKKELAERACLQALQAGRLSDACSAMSAYEATRLDPFDIQLNPPNQEVPPGLEVLQAIFAARPARQADFGEEVMKEIRVAAAMLHLWGTNNPARWLSAGAERSELNWPVEVRTLLFHALGKTRIQAMKQAGIKRVEILGSGAQDDCPVCRADAGKIFPTDAAPFLPHEACSCEAGCRCVMIAVQ